MLPNATDGTKETAMSRNQKAIRRESNRRGDTYLQPEERSLIKSAQEGDSTAFELIYRLHSRRVYSLCLRMIRNQADAEELTQEAFLQVFRKIRTFRSESQFSTWMHRLTVNIVLMRLRRKRLDYGLSENSSEQDDRHAPINLDHLGFVDAEVRGTIDRVMLERAFRRLAPGYRTMLMLHDVQGYDHDEIARLLGCSIGNTKSQLHKARLRLRGLISAGTLSDFQNCAEMRQLQRQNV